MGRAKLFAKYGETDEDRAMKIESHMLRHLQNTELFRLGVADTIISKRFNRRSVAQSYEYDHRSLAEDLDQIETPAGHRDHARRESQYGCTGSSRAARPTARSSMRSSVSRRPRATPPRMNTCAPKPDGFHATPYGHCLNSFTVDPCPKHLECFADCRHLSATDLPENRQNLIRLEGKFKPALETIKARPSTSIGWQNQLEHAEKRLDGVQKILATPPGERPFPDGVDLSLPRNVEYLMSEPDETTPSSDDDQMREILETLLADDEDITARAVARLHPSIKAASSITRSESRSRLLAQYQLRQADYRQWRARVAKRSGADTAASLADKDVTDCRTRSHCATADRFAPCHAARRRRTRRLQQVGEIL